jgi:superfamily I DNA/RNA helicase
MPDRAKRQSEAAVNQRRPCRQKSADFDRHSQDDEVEQARFARELDTYATRLGRDYPKPPTREVAARKLFDDVLGFVGRSRLVAVHPAYGQGEWLEKVLASAAMHLAQSAAGTSDWTAMLDAYEGLHAIPLMTIHKSKGLEYHTVIFVGLDDGAWWSFADDQVEATAGFFVAFTRAKQRVVFTYCARRGTRTKIATLYELLAQAGVQTFKIT